MSLSKHNLPNEQLLLCRWTNTSSTETTPAHGLISQAVINPISVYNEEWNRFLLPRPDNCVLWDSLTLPLPLTDSHACFHGYPVGGAITHLPEECRIYGGLFPPQNKGKYFYLIILTFFPSQFHDIKSELCVIKSKLCNIK